MIKTLSIALLFLAFLNTNPINATEEKHQVVNIIIKGNKITKSPIILRELTIKKGEFIGLNEIKQLIIESRNNLTNTNLFKKKLINFKFGKIWKNTRFTIDYLQDFLFFKELIRLVKKEKLELNFKNIEKTLKENRSIKKLNIKQQDMYKTNLKINTNIYYLNNKNKKTSLPYV